MSSPAPPEPRLRPDGIADLAGIGPWRLVVTAVRTSPVLVDGVVVTGVLALLAGTGRIVAPLTIQHAVDSDFAPSAVQHAVLVGLVAVVVAGLSSLALNRRLQHRVETALADLRRRGLRRVHEMPATTADRVPSADLVARLTSDVDQVTTFLQGGGVQLVTNGAQLVVATAVLLAYSWQLAVPVLVLAVLLLVVMVLVQRVIAARFDRVRTDFSQLQSVVAESVVGVPVIRSTGIDERIRTRLDAAIDRARDSQLHTLRPLHGNTSLGELAISTMTVAVILGGVWWATAGDPATPRLSAGELIAMVFLVTFFVRPLQFLVQSLGEAQNALTGWRRTLELVVTPSAEAVDGRPLPDGALSVSFAGVSARYADGPPVLHGISVDVAAGEHVAVVGRTGSGKSTFAKLLTRRIEPAAGDIAIGGVPLAAVDARALAGRVVIVPQDPFLFAGTVAANIALGSPVASAADVAVVLERLGLGDWLETLPEGLDTQVGLRGERLSVGERQLVALARTALVDPDLVILDEATSGVDPGTDVAVQAALGVLTQGRTTISIAHRMITATTADRVLVFDDGRIVEAGHHLDLIAREGGGYARLFAIWRDRPPVP